MVRVKGTLISTASDPLTKEQMKSRSAVEEDVDVAGVVKRHRVVDQTIWDLMFLHEMIDQPQHEALNLFMDDLVRSGAFPSGARLDRDPGDTSRSPSDVNAERRMAFSSAYRAMVHQVGDDPSNMVVKIFSSASFYRKKKMNTEDSKTLKKLSVYMNGALWALAKHYKTMGIRDPRKILRKQVGNREKTWKVVDPYYKKKKRDRR